MLLMAFVRGLQERGEQNFSIEFNSALRHGRWSLSMCVGDVKWTAHGTMMERNQHQSNVSRVAGQVQNECGEFLMSRRDDDELNWIRFLTSCGSTLWMSCSPASDVVTSLQRACSAAGVRPGDAQKVLVSRSRSVGSFCDRFHTMDCKRPLFMTTEKMFTKTVHIIDRNVFWCHKGN